MACPNLASPSRLSNDDCADVLMNSPHTTVSEIKIPLEVDGDHEDGKENAGPDYCKSNSNSKGVFLTWDDLWVSVPNGKKGCKAILQGLTGYARPGELLAIMGPSGCGKSTLLDALAGRLDSISKQRGEILVNGRMQQLAYGTSAYVTQDNILTWTLTTREAVYYSAQLQLPNTMSKAEKIDRADRTIREMGLQSCIDTRIGGWGSKGLSGGQKRRVSICIEMLTRPKLLFLDEPTSGLDSAASYYVMNRIVELAKEYGMTVIASMHQPSTEVCNLLDNLCLLSLGRTIYFGPSFAASQFFTRNGFSCPGLQNPADHYIRMINTDFDEDIESAAEGKTTTREAIDKLVDSYTSSDIYNLTLSVVAQINGQQLRVMAKKRRRASFFMQCLVLTERSFVNMYRDLGYYWLRLAIYITLAFGLGTVFYNVGNSYNSINARASMLMFVASLLTLLSIGGFPSFVEEIKVFQRERLNGHYGVAAFVISNTVSSVLFLFLIAVIPGVIAYYLVGLHRGTERFLYFTMVLFASIVLVEGLMMIVASLVPNFLMGLIIGAGTQGVMMLSGGFFRLPDDLPKIFWKYPIYYISFHRYAYQGLYKNEFEGLKFPSNELMMGGSSLIDGETILRDTWQVERGYSKWIDLAILFLMVIIYRLLFFGIIKVRESIKPLVKRFHLGLSYKKE
ncbi:ABC transporter G family member 1-like isoform X1 [Coffea arabica]|uniref:ABC transporter G family member 1-like isoform X1 n=1 Tax=Coffea arabica TaxID=13443 RepID=A0A6P6VUL5_COFAR|nr:ABC transporter G family member 11-like [Coffea arabica]